MTSTIVFPGIQKHIPVMGDMTLKSPIAYKATRVMASAFNATQMALAEAYINGLERCDVSIAVAHRDARFVYTGSWPAGPL